VARTEGFRGFQGGLSAAVLLQFTNNCFRFGSYGVVKHICEISDKTEFRFIKSFGLAFVSSAVSAVITNPFYLLKVRLQSATSAGQGLRSTARSVYNLEGLRGYWRGTPAFVTRSALGGSTQLATYDVAKQFVVQHANRPEMCPEGIHSGPFQQTSLSTHVVASIITGAAVVFVIQPFDFAATRIMNDRKGLYANSFDVLRKTALGKEGSLRIYTGMFAHYCRFAPQCILTFVFLEQLKNFWGETHS